MVTIYGLVNIATNDTYVGCTAGKLGKRMREHRCLLNAGKHAAKRLQSDWNELGPSGFRLNVLEALPSDVSVVLKRERELHWMRHYLEQGRLYNDNRTSFQPPNEAPAKAAAQRKANGYRPSEESNQKRRLAQIGKPKGHGAKISETKKRLGQRPSLEAAIAGGIAATAKRYARTDEIVSSALEDEGAGARDKEPGT
jgi:hypothetical protein